MNQEQLDKIPLTEPFPYQEICPELNVEPDPMESSMGKPPSLWTKEGWVGYSEERQERVKRVRRKCTLYKQQVAENSAFFDNKTKLQDLKFVAEHNLQNNLNDITHKNAALDVSMDMASQAAQIQRLRNGSFLDIATGVLSIGSNLVGHQVRVEQERISQALESGNQQITAAFEEADGKARERHRKAVQDIRNRSQKEQTQMDANRRNWLHKTTSTIRMMQSEDDSRKKQLDRINASDASVVKGIQSAANFLTTMWSSGAPQVSISQGPQKSFLEWVQDRMQLLARAWAPTLPHSAVWNIGQYTTRVVRIEDMAIIAVKANSFPVNQGSLIQSVQAKWFPKNIATQLTPLLATSPAALFLGRGGQMRTLSSGDWKQPAVFAQLAYLLYCCMRTRIQLKNIHSHEFRLCPRSNIDPLFYMVSSSACCKVSLSDPVLIWIPLSMHAFAPKAQSVSAWHDAIEAVSSVRGHRSSTTLSTIMQSIRASVVPVSSIADVLKTTPEQMAMLPSADEA